MVHSDAQMENDYASLVRGDQGNKDCSENIPSILLPTKCENEEVRGRHLASSSGNTPILLRIIAYTDIRCYDIESTSIATTSTVLNDYCILLTVEEATMNNTSTVGNSFLGGRNWSLCTMTAQETTAIPTEGIGDKVSLLDRSWHYHDRCRYVHIFRTRYTYYMVPDNSMTTMYVL